MKREFTNTIAYKLKLRMGNRIRMDALRLSNEAYLYKTEKLNNPTLHIKNDGVPHLYILSNTCSNFDSWHTHSLHYSRLESNLSASTHSSLLLSSC
ncbi:hypothetical protein C1H46_004448 [Malus baccata]|uniref:Uncharacterized protein n=1 Tax=Malus baccata TaxID=106549 RepID=A0A540NH81_MALBA|nr:hypothetical protein C1H46_004448 [Malus baccata]